MQLHPDELERHLKSRLAPVYLVAGEEPLFLRESLDAIRAAARAGGCSDREVLDAEAGFDWGRLGESAGNLSLFGERRLIELRLPSGKPGAAGAKAIAAYCEAPPSDVVLLISCGPLETAQRKSAWVNAIDAAGVFVYAWPLPLAQLPAWVGQRLARRGLSAPADAVALLAERSEGNLLAAVQEIEKLYLLYGGGELTLEQVREAVVDSARFGPFDLADAAVEGNVARCMRIARGLKQEGEDPILTLWALARDVRVLSELAARRPPEETFRRHKIWNRPRQSLLSQAARRAPAEFWQGLLSRAARTDRVLKGLEPGRPWDELLHLATAIARATARSAPPGPR